MDVVKGPRVERRVELHFVGDKGTANLHRVCGWLGAMLMERAGEGSRFAIWNTSHCAADTVRMVARGECDMAMSTPAHMVRNAVDGIGIYAGQPVSNLMSLGTFPQTDSLLFAIDASLGIRSFDDIRKKKPALHISTQPNDGESYMGFAVERILEAADIPKEKILEWGGSFVHCISVAQYANAVREGRANVLFFEAVMTPYWRNLARDKKLNFLPYDPEVLADLKQRFRWQTNVLPAGAMEGLNDDIELIDWSDFASLVRPEFPDDVAYVLAWAACNTQDVIERQYRHIPRQFSPITYPIEPQNVAKTHLPLHPGAARYYREAGLI